MFACQILKCISFRYYSRVAGKITLEKHLFIIAWEEFQRENYGCIIDDKWQFIDQSGAKKEG